MAQEKEIQPTTAVPHEHYGVHDHKSAADRVTSDARNATDNEHNMTLMQGIRLYPKAIGWSILIRYEAHH
jgi:SP family general alpha glucoside:H+ symporter-like MFS transporter